MSKQLLNENLQNINEFYFEILKRLVKQNALDSSIICTEKKEINLKFLQKVTETIFFTMKTDKILSESSLNELFNSSEEYQNNFNSAKNSTTIQVMSFPMIILYKTLPCPRGQQCKGKPREIAPYNQYSDEELSCVFYHHHKDRRRITITSRVHDEFLYKANYDRKKEMLNNTKYSRNYFESIYHPIYYKLFKCKRVGCNQFYNCPFNHNQKEKLFWDEIFQTYFLKKREMYTGKNFNFPLKELGRVPFETDSYLQYNEREFKDESCNSKEFCFKDTLNSEKVSLATDDESERDYEEDYDSEVTTNTSNSFAQSSSLNYLSSPLFSFVQTTSISLNYSSATSFAQSSSIDCLINSSKDLQDYSSGNEKDSRKIYANSIEDYYDFPTLIPIKNSSQSCELKSNDCGVLGHFFDWEKVKNIMNINLSKPIV